MEVTTGIEAMRAGTRPRMGRTADPILDAYFREVDRIPTLSQQEENDLMAEVKKGDRHAINTLVSGNLKFAIAVCWKYRNCGLPMGDLINEANLGLFRAAEHFAPTKGIRFLSYAVWWIRSGILTAIARQPGAISFPPARMALASRMRRVENALTQRLGRRPRSEEMSAALGTSGKVLASVTNLADCISSTRRSAIRPESDSWVPSLAACDDEGSGIPDLFIGKNLGRHMQRLAARERRVLSLRYGFQGACFSLAEVSGMLGVTRERVRQIELKALGRLRNSTRALRG